MSNDNRKRSIRKERRLMGKDPTIIGLFEVLLRPLLAQQPSGWDRGDWLSHLFGVDHRAINHFRARASFTMPGAIMLTPLLESHVVSQEERKISRNDLVCVRFDSLDNDRVDVELVLDPNSDEENTRLFRLSISQYEEIRHNFVPSH